MQSNNAFKPEDDSQAPIDVLADIAAMLNHANASQKLEAKKPLRLDLSTILAINAGLEKMDTTGHGQIIIDITQFRFSKVTWSESLLLPEQKKRRAAR